MASHTPAQEQHLDHDAVREELDLDEAVKRLGRMAGVKSIHRNLRSEDSAVERDIEAHQSELHGAGYKAGPERSDDGMDIMAARDVHVNPRPAAPASSEVAKLLKIAGLIAASMAGGGTATYLATKQPPAAVQPTKPDKFDVDLEAN